MTLDFRCIVTGCALVIEPGEYYHGDAHRLGETIVFNSVIDGGTGEPIVQEGTPGNDDYPAILVDFDCEPFHRRGVFVMPSYGVTFNEAAIRRINYDPAGQ